MLMAANSSPDFARTALDVVGVDCRAAAVESVGLLEKPSLGFEAVAMAARYFLNIAAVGVLESVEDQVGVLRKLELESCFEGTELTPGLIWVAGCRQVTHLGCPCRSYSTRVYVLFQLARNVLIRPIHFAYRSEK